MVHGGVPNVRLLGASEEAFERPRPFFDQVNGRSELLPPAEDGEWEELSGDLLVPASGASLLRDGLWH